MIKYLMLAYRFRFIFVSLVMLVGLFLASIPLSSIETRRVQAQAADASADEPRLSDNPNVITSGAVVAADRLGQATTTAAYTANNGIKTAASVVAQAGKQVARGAQIGAIAVARGVGNGLAFMGRSVGAAASFVYEVPGQVVGFASDAPIVGNFIRPSDHVEVPIIDPNSPELHKALAALPPTKKAGPAKPQNNAGPQWPMHGAVTTHFGVDHWPFQPTHSGIDISDGQPPGVTPIKPFRPGRVIDVVHSSQGLGNHVIVDHGNGVTSVYAHLDSISAHEGQAVGLDTVLGRQGTTGVSTGPHLHFEIRVHGQAADPGQFIGGRP